MFSSTKTRRTIRTVIIILEILALLVEGGILFVLSKLDRIQKVNIAAERLEENISSQAKESTEAGEMHGYTNIALFGVDTRTGQLKSDTRSDTILIASINNDTSEVRLVSIYRDTYLNLGNDSYNKANSAYSQGGPAQAIDMLNKNLDLNITDFVTIGFAGLVDTIDALGGIDLELTDEEVRHLNDYQKIMAKQQDREYIEVTQSGYQHLNGLQATAYCRIRYTAGDDFKRAERQRLVLEKVFELSKHASLAELNAIVNAVTDEIYTSLTNSEILSYVARLTGFELVDSGGFPTETMRKTGTVGRKGSCVMPVTLEANVAWLHEYLFEEYDYTPSDEVMELSERIGHDTGFMLDDEGNIVAWRASGNYDITPSNSGSQVQSQSPSRQEQNDATAGLRSMIDPLNGQTVWYDPYTGVVIDPATGLATGALADPATGNVVHPELPGQQPAVEEQQPIEQPQPPVEPVTEAPAADPVGQGADPAMQQPADPTSQPVDPAAQTPAEPVVP